MALSSIVIIGAGQAGGWAARTLRGSGFAGTLVLCGNEAHAPYERPPLSKTILAGQETEPPAVLTTDEMRALDIEFLPGTRATRLVPEQRTVPLDSGRTLSYDKLLLCMGGRAAIPSIPGVNLDGVFTLRSIEDARRLHERLRSGTVQRVAVIGGGWIGLEVAATIRGLEIEVAIYEFAERLCARSVMPEVSALLQAMHEKQGVQIHTHTQVTEISPSSAGLALRLADGQTAQFDAVILATGMRSNDELAKAAGLECDNGVLVDTACRTSAPHIYAAGDVAALRAAPAARPIRFESWQNAQDQAVDAAKSMLGQAVAYNPVPRVWSEQHGAMIQIVGHAHDVHSTVVRQMPDEDRVFSFGLNAANRVVAAVAFNAGRDFRAVRALVEKGIPADRNLLADPTVPLAQLTK